jgi:hypothetical protein
MESSIDQLQHESPDIFDFKDQRGSNPKILSDGRYILGLLNNLGERGLCAYFNGNAIQVKKTNAFDDSFVVMSSSGYVRRGPNAYSVTCVPASFPKGQPPPSPPAVAGCALGGSRAITCGADPAQYIGVIGDSIAEVVKEHPELFDLTNIQAGTTDGYLVKDRTGFTQAVSAVLTTKGFCSVFTGDMQLKSDNTRSEAYHILTGSNHVRHDIGSYNGACYPAAF